MSRSSDETFDADDVRAAERLDRDIDAALRGSTGPQADSVVLWLTASTRSAPPRSLTRRVSATVRSPREDRYGRARAVAGVLAALLAIQGLGNIFAGNWLAGELGEPWSPHVMYEGGLALLAAAMAVAAGALHRDWLPVAVFAGVPLGVMLAGHGVGELTTFAWGAALHVGEGVVALALLVTWWRARRYARAPRREE